MVDPIPLGARRGIASNGRVSGARSMCAGLAVAVLFVSLAPSCLDRRDDVAPESTDARCAGCHGDPKRAGDFLQRSAPPIDLVGSSDPGSPGVGAHMNHLYASTTHAAIACNECHIVPDSVASPGHADSARPAEVNLGDLAKTGGREPSYDFMTRRCGDTYCHREADAIWTAPRSSADACGSCHDLPPPSPHPQSDRCSLCHGKVVDEQRHFVAPELHVNGKVDVETGTCHDCHGSTENPAPPVDTLGNSDVSAIGVGAHQVHLAGGTFSRPLDCSECHVVPATVDAPGHADGLPAELTFSGVGTTNMHAPIWNRTVRTCSDSWCHGPDVGGVATSPDWTSQAALDCTSCHGHPPPAPHPQATQCSVCHAEVVAADELTILDRNRHVDGVIDVIAVQSCTACHGSTNPAPPPDLSGATSTSAAGVGAHQAHLAGTAWSRPVPCGECHVVPMDVLDPGHVDTPLPAEVVFSGAAKAFGGTPIYAGGTCQSTSCHGAVFPSGDPSGGSNTTPVWTQVDGSQATCGSCHAIPPPAPHPVASLNPICSACHEDIAPDNVTFVRPDLHVDGVVTFTVP